MNQVEEAAQALLASLVDEGDLFGLNQRDVARLTVNMARLCDDARYLTEDGRHASAFNLAVLAFEEAGKLASYALEQALPTVQLPRGPHKRKQTAAALVIVSGAVRDELVRLVAIGHSLEVSTLSPLLSQYVRRSDEVDSLDRILAGKLAKLREASTYCDVGASASESIEFERRQVDAMIANSDRVMSLLHNGAVIAGAVRLVSALKPERLR